MDEDRVRTIYLLVMRLGFPDETVCDRVIGAFVSLQSAEQRREDHVGRADIVEGLRPIDGTPEFFVRPIALEDWHLVHIAVGTPSGPDPT